MQSPIFPTINTEHRQLNSPLFGTCKVTRRSLHCQRLIHDWTLDSKSFRAQRFFFTMNDHSTHESLHLIPSFYLFSFGSIIGLTLRMPSWWSTRWSSRTSRWTSTRRTQNMRPPLIGSRLRKLMSFSASSLKSRTCTGRSLSSHYLRAWSDHIAFALSPTLGRCMYPLITGHTRFGSRISRSPRSASQKVSVDSTVWSHNCNFKLLSFRIPL